MCYVAHYYGNSFRTVCRPTVVIFHVVTIYRSGFVSARVVLDRTICRYALATTCYSTGKFKLLETKFLI